MRILYIFPHPDDESFGPAPVIRKQVDAGHEVSLLTLTRGGATKVRDQLGLSIEEMGELRYREMLEVQKVLGLSNMTVLDLPDSKLAELDPREIETIVADHIRKIQPQLIITYPVHGVSGFHDHLVTHAVVKRVFLQLRDEGADFLKRLAFMTMPNRVTEPMQRGTFLMKQSDPALIDCEILLNDHDREIFKASLSCYQTYREVIEKSGVLQMVAAPISKFSAKITNRLCPISQKAWLSVADDCDCSLPEDLRRSNRIFLPNNPGLWYIPWLPVHGQHCPTRVKLD